MRYIPNSQADRQKMLAGIGIDSIEQLFSGIPAKLRLRRLLDLPKALSEPELLGYFQERAAQNAVDSAAFIGAGIYRHHIPIIIDALISRSEFYTAYTHIRLRFRKARYRQSSNSRLSWRNSPGWKLRTPRSTTEAPLLLKAC
jgi:glycine cleavage system pyridoxal-binding protein P